MAWLLIDNSNSRTKFRLGDAEGLHGWSAVMPTARVCGDSLRRLGEEIDFSAVVVASVVPEKERVLADHYGESFPYHRLTWRSPLGYGFDLAAPGQIGNDRLANAVALKAGYGTPGIAIDFGTAVTFSVLSGGGNFAGGAIAPGMRCATDYLSGQTAQLPSVDPEAEVPAIGRSTVEAIRIGAVTGQRGMVREILRLMIPEIGKGAVVVATGGGAELAARDFPEISRVEPSLTLEGLRIVAGKVF